MAIGENRAVFLDRDGVIIKEKEFVIDIDRLEFIPRSIDALRRLPAEFLKIIISNQSGVGRGYFNLEQVESFNSALIELLKKKGVLIDKIYYCPHRPEDNCECRKPASGLFNRADRQFGIDFSRSWVIGDKSTDILAGKNIGAKTILVRTGYAGREPGAQEAEADYTAGDLFEAVEIIRK